MGNTPPILTLAMGVPALIAGVGSQIGLTLTFIGLCVGATGAFIAIPVAGMTIISLLLLSPHILPLLALTI
jgi:hypothetical protein